MKIALCTETLYPLYGVERRVYELARRLPDYGFEVEVFTSTPPQHFKDIAVTQVCPPTIVSPPKRDYVRCVQYWKALFKTLMNRQCDVIDANGHLSLVPCSLAGAAAGAPVVATIHDLYLTEWFRMYRGLGACFGLPFELLFTRLPYDHVITLNSSLAQRLVRLGMNKEKVSVIPSGIDIRGIDAVSPAKKEGNRVLYAGRLAPQKDVGVLVEAVALLDECRLLIVGEGNDRARIVKKIQVLGLEERVVLVQPYKRHRELIAAIKGSAVLALPSQRECFGIVPLEAMACRTPVVSTNTEGPRDYIESGKNGFLTEIGNPHELAEKISLLLNDADLRKEVQRRARKTAERYDWSRIVRAVVKLYEKVQQQ